MNEIVFQQVALDAYRYRSGQTQLIYQVQKACACLNSILVLWSSTQPLCLLQIAFFVEVIINTSRR